MGTIKNASNFPSENLKGRDHLEDLGIDGRKILGRILEKEGGKV
jgi:hypothetical protein